MIVWYGSGYNIPNWHVCFLQCLTVANVMPRQEHGWYEGAVRGVADLILLIPKKGWASLCIEMKTPKGTQSEHQRTWQTEAERYQNKYVICHSLQEFINEVNSYLQ